MRTVNLFVISLFVAAFTQQSKSDDFDAPSWRSYEPTLSVPNLSLLDIKATKVPKVQGNRLASSAHLEPSRPEQSDDRDSIEQVIQRANELIGRPYRWGGMSEATGFDCSGLLVYLFNTEAGIKLPRTTSLMVKDDFERVSKTGLRPGDAVFFSQNGSDTVNHVGLYVGDDRFIHAPRTGKNIRIDSLESGYWSKRYVTARRFESGVGNAG
ncbi:C40 family peptidase [Pseudomonas sp. S2_F03]